MCQKAISLYPNIAGNSAIMYLSCTFAFQYHLTLLNIFPNPCLANSLEEGFQNYILINKYMECPIFYNRFDMSCKPHINMKMVSVILILFSSHVMVLSIWKSIFIFSHLTYYSVYLFSLSGKAFLY